GSFSRRFPERALGTSTEMCGSATWEKGEWTDDTQMALIVAGSLLRSGELEEAEIFDGFVAWAHAPLKDIGNQTSAVLRSGLPWDQAAADYVASGRQAAGNGSLMRSTPGAIFFAGNHDASVDAARRISALTHADPAADEGCVIFHLLVAAALAGRDPVAEVGGALEVVKPAERERWARVLDPAWTPDKATESNGAVWPTLGTALWALRRSSTFEGALRLAVDVGNDTDTVACVTGAIAGAVYGIGGIPSRWTTVVHGDVPGNDAVATDLTGLTRVAGALLTGPGSPARRPTSGGDERPAGEPAIPPVEVLPKLWLTNLTGAAQTPPDAAVISLCRTFDEVPHETRRAVYLIDKDDNPAVDTVLRDVLDEIDAFHAEGRDVVVHCWGGRSRTGLVLRAYLRRTRGLSAAEATAEAKRLWRHTDTWNTSFDTALERYGGPAG
ncbi:MAG TPA: ADP-ribosylglycohydrolase family protein, partial [Mycobacteriales bacterium]|nr:ADP-ribosylglycohydrolase family protein [Mycobacteriales bacterium]